MQVDWLKQRANLSPLNIAIVDIDLNKKYSYEEMNARVEAMANYLISNGIEKGDRVAIFSANHIAYLDVYFACNKLGAIFLPLNWRLKSPEIEAIISDADPKVIIYSTFKFDRIKNIPSEKMTLCLDDTEKYEEILDNHNYPFEYQKEVREEDLAMLVYTSGTTGTPKGVMISHRMMIANAINTITTWQLTENNKTITLSPMFHIAGLSCFLMPLLFIGGTVTIIKFFDYESLGEMIDYYQITHMFMVPTMYLNWINNQAFRPEQLRGVKTFITGGGLPSQKVHDVFAKHDLPIVNSFGMSEAGSNNFYISPKLAKHDSETIGKPMMFCKAKIVNKNNKEVEIGKVGELTLAGAHTFSGYWKNKIETDKVLELSDEGNIVHTGDLAYINNEGNYYIVGRKKEMIVTGGENVFPIEIEKLLRTHPAVKEVAVVGLPHADYGEIVGAAIVLKEGYDNHEQVKIELVLLSNDNLANYKLPRKYIFLDQLPETSVGKVDKKQISNLF